MITLLSPAKSLDYETPLPVKRVTKPRLLDDSERLADLAKNLSPQQLSSLMSISDKLGVLNYDRFQQWQAAPESSSQRAAVFAFKGDVYQGLDAYSLNADDAAFAQTHLRILSGLYGLLRPLDAILPYRLEMGTRFENPRGKDLYAFWQQTLTEQTNKDLKQSEGDARIVNLASNEYFKALLKSELDGDLLTPIFKDEKNGTYKLVSFYAKRARGAMARFIIDNRVTTADDLKEFAWEGYRFQKSASSDSEFIFHRKQK